MRSRAFATLATLAALAVAGCRPATPSPHAAPVATAADTVEARRAFLGNIDAIHKRDRARYLASYLQGPTLVRNGPAGLELGFEGWSARRDSTWPDTLIAEDVRVVPVVPGVVYGTYRYRVTQAGATTSGVSERVLVRTPDGWKIAVTTAFPVAAPVEARR